MRLLEETGEALVSAALESTGQSLDDYLLDEAA